jgi:hypothetical protein
VIVDDNSEPNSEPESEPPSEEEGEEEEGDERAQASGKDTFEVKKAVRVAPPPLDVQVMTILRMVLQLSSAPPMNE